MDSVKKLSIASWVVQFRPPTLNTASLGPVSRRDQFLRVLTVRLNLTAASRIVMSVPILGTSLFCNAISISRRIIAQFDHLRNSGACKPPLVGFGIVGKCQMPQSYRLPAYRLAGWAGWVSR